MDTSRHCEPAASLIARLGGLTVVATAANVSITQVQRWRMPKERGGTGGSIPRWHAPALVELAAARGEPLGADDFLEIRKAG